MNRRTQHTCSRDERIEATIARIKNEINAYHLDFVRRHRGHPVLKPMLAAANRIFLSGEAKRVRAIIPRLIAESGVCDLNTANRYGVLIELLHFASLVHDDVIDEADERRLCPSLNAEFRNADAVLVGDHFICDSIAYALETKHNTIVIGISMAAVKDLITGVIMEQQFGKRRLRPSSYFRMAELKTGCLFGLSFGLPYAGTDRMELARHLGVRFGVLFQIYDDYMDREQDKGWINIYRILSPAGIDRKCRALYRSVHADCRRLGIGNVLDEIVRYLQAHGYFFNIPMA